MTAVSQPHFGKPCAPLPKTLTVQEPRLTCAVYPASLPKVSSTASLLNGLTIQPS
jgi:hypothetical protein